MLNVVIAAVIVATGAALIWPPIRKAALWRAAITPLASIIGSGFLVLGPILDITYGAFAPVVMAALCAVAWGLGSAIRFNIAAMDWNAADRGRLETLGAWALAFAYVVSVAYYLNLFGSFALRLTPFDTDFNARLVTTGMFALILAIGWGKGFAALERAEMISVGVKLAIIAGLLVGLGWTFAERAGAGELVAKTPDMGGWAGVTMAFGLLVTVQGFETSRYLGAEYGAEVRIRSMKLAQAISSVIYVVYIAMFAYLFAPSAIELDETAIIELMGRVAAILPFLLTAAALSAQFSAAVADTSGSGGLLAELTGGRVSPRTGYAILVGCGLALTWGLGVFEIISWASRAFAVYYAIQATLAAQAARGGKSVLFWGLATLAAAIAILGTPVE